MDFETVLKECQALPKNAELAERLLGIQDEAQKAGDAEAFVKTTNLLVDTYLVLQETDAAIAMLQAVLKQNAFEDYRTIVALTDRLVQLLLKTEDFGALEQVLEYRGRFVSGIPSQTMMQQFYLSVCYEGQKKYDQAIKALLQVGEGISSTNLVAKHLKLAMLYLKTNDLLAARNAYEHALLFDKPKKNEMFFLVESDLLFAEGRILNALKAYQDFFLRSKTKNRYLDRYVTINARLGNYDEAWRFFREYEKKTAANVSKNYRLELYEAGLAVAETLKDYPEAARIREKILQLQDKEPELIDSFEGIKAILEAANRIPPEGDRRGVVLELFRILHRTVDLPRCLFVAPAPEGVLVETYTKGLLMDRTIALADLANTAVGAVIEADRDYLLLAKKDFADLVDHVENRPLKDGVHVAVVAFKVRAVGTTAGFLVVYLDKDRDFDFVTKLLAVVKLEIEAHFDFTALREHDAALAKTAAKVFAAFGTGTFRIESGLLFLDDDRARTLLGIDRPFIAFEEFQSRLGDKPLFVDDFVGKTTLTFPITGFQEKKMLWKAIVWLEGAAIHFAATDVLDDVTRQAELTRQATVSYVYGLGSMHALERALQETETQRALARFCAFGLTSADATDRIAGGRLLADTVRRTGGEWLVGLYQADDGAFLALYDTIDKRVLDRIGTETVAQASAAIGQALPRVPLPRVRVGFSNVLRNRSLAETAAKAAFAQLADDDLPVRHFDRDLMVRENRLEGIATHLSNLLAADGIRPTYAQVGNLYTKKVEMYRIGLHPDPVIGDPLLRRAAVRRHGLGTALSTALLVAVAKDADQLFREHGITLRFAVPIHPAALLAEGFAEGVLKTLRQRHQPASRLVLVIVPDGVVGVADVLAPLARLAEAGIAFGFDGRSASMPPWQETDAVEWDYVWIDPDVVPTPAYALWEAYAGAAKTLLVAAPVDDEATAVAVRDARIAFAEGGLLATFASIAELAAAIR